jgi:UDP-N-acetylglucosamine 2-epimerase (non-hydrolysing)/GDP/UDP-N,N'-diacetylbacillosamine 2-epimerase (hydrolysing)
MRLIQDDSELTLRIIATNMHLSAEFGLTYKEIEKDGFKIDRKVEMLLSSDTANATTKSVGLAIIGFADAYEELHPDLIVVLGDRSEILAAVTAALFYKIPVAHLHGGEITLGAYDDTIRHSVSKMSHLHFTSTEVYRKRVIQLGENPEHVFNVGAIGIDNIKHMELLSKNELEKDLKFKINGKCILVTFHPVTLENNTSEEQTGNLLKVLGEMDDLRIIFTMPNSDSNGRIIMRMIDKFVNENSERCVVFTSLGHLRYLSLLKYVDAVVGNSSSGIIEAPSFKVPVLNIGNRQGGRIRSKSIIDCNPDYDDIKINLQKVLSKSFKESCQHFTNPYEKNDTAEEIYSVLKNFKLDRLINKEFYNL